MLRNTEDLHNFDIQATDGDLGKVKDLYFDDDAWTVRYFVVETGSWLSSRKILISPYSVNRTDWKEKCIQMDITTLQVENSPNIDSNMPVSRQIEERYLTYYGYPYYWKGTGLWEDALYPSNSHRSFDRDEPAWSERQGDDEAALAAERIRQRNRDPHLRSTHAVHGYHVKALDGEIGHVSGFLIDDETWALRYLVVDTSNWWFGHQVLIAPHWVACVNWSEQHVSVDLERKVVQKSPAYNPKVSMDRPWEGNLHRHYGRSGYWTHAKAP